MQSISSWVQTVHDLNNNRLLKQFNPTEGHISYYLEHCWAINYAAEDSRNVCVSSDCHICEQSFWGECM